MIEAAHEPTEVPIEDEGDGVDEQNASHWKQQSSCVLQKRQRCEQKNIILCVGLLGLMTLTHTFQLFVSSIFNNLESIVKFFINKLLIISLKIINVGQEAHILYKLHYKILES